MSCEGECACLCHSNVEEPGPHLDTCSWAGPEYQPHVCPGCYAVGGEPCAAYCIDAELARDREEFDGECWEDDDHAE